VLAFRIGTEKNSKNFLRVAGVTRPMSAGAEKSLICFGINLMVTLLLAGIGLDILHTVQAQAGQVGTDLAILAKAMAGSAILLGIIAKAPDAVASIAGVSTGGLATE
jgi:hypothetical protein